MRNIVLGMRLTLLSPILDRVRRSVRILVRALLGLGAQGAGDGAEKVEVQSRLRGISMVLVMKI
jgi:hypothetical protein